jgi:hypothetical protein
VSSFSAERQLILLSAGIEARRRGQRGLAADLARQTDWARLAESLERRRLLPTLGPRIVEMVGEVADRDFVDRVAEAVELCRRQGAFLQLISARLSDRLAAAGIRSFPLKGADLGELLYGDPGRRLASDIDLLVSAADLQRAVQIVRDLGYRAPADHVDEAGLPLLHFALAHEREELPPTELHWRIHWYEDSFAGERLLPPADAGAGWRRPAPVDEGAALLLFYARDGFVDLRLATDIGAWWDLYGDGLDPAPFGELLRLYPALRRPLLAAGAAAEAVIGLPSGRLFGESTKVGIRGRMAARLANPNPGPRTRLSQINAHQALVDALLMPGGGGRAFRRRQLLLPSEVLNERAEKLGLSPRSQLSHAVRTATRLGYAATRLRRAPETVC